MNVKRPVCCPTPHKGLWLVVTVAIDQTHETQFRFSMQFVLDYPILIWVMLHLPTKLESKTWVELLTCWYSWPLWSQKIQNFPKKYWPKWSDQMIKYIFQTYSKKYIGQNGLNILATTKTLRFYNSHNGLTEFTCKISNWILKDEKNLKLCRAYYNCWTLLMIQHGSLHWFWFCIVIINRNHDQSMYPYHHTTIWPSRLKSQILVP